MDNLTHTLTAVAISQAGINRKTRLATLTVILGANVPDLDILAGLKDSTEYLKYHRGITHSFVGITALALVVWGVTSVLGKKLQPQVGRPPLRSGWLLVAAILGAGSHLLLDFSNSYGVRPFLPFSGRWFAWDVMFIFDPVLLVLLVLGLGVPWLLRLVSTEVGAQRARPVGGAVFCLCVIVAMLGLRDFAHRRALTILDSRTYSDKNPVRLGAFPVPVNPFSWTGVVETDSAFHIERVNALNPNTASEQLTTFRKPEPSPALDAARKTRTARIFLDFARLPWGEAQENEEGFQVSWRDLRFYGGALARRGFVTEVDLDRSLNVRSQAFYFSSPHRGDQD